MKKYLFLVVFFAIAFNTQSYSKVNSDIAIVPPSYERDDDDDDDCDCNYDDDSDSNVDDNWNGGDSSGESNGGSSNGSSDIPLKDGVPIVNGATHVQKGTAVYKNYVAVREGTLVVEGNLTASAGMQILAKGKVIVKPGATLVVKKLFDMTGSVTNNGILNFDGFDLYVKSANGIVNEEGGEVKSKNLILQQGSVVNNGKMYIGRFSANWGTTVKKGVGSITKITDDWISFGPKVFVSPEGISCLEYAAIPDITFDKYKQPLNSNNINLCLSAGSTVTNYGIATYIDNCGGCEEALPIGLNYFKLEHPQGINNIILFKWATETETNNDFFTIQSSYDGVNFIDEEIIPGAGNSSQTIEYERIITFSEEPPMYFRLKQTDYDGSVSYSSVVVDKESFETNFLSVKTIGEERIEVNLNLQSPSPVVVNLLTPQGVVKKSIEYSLLDSGAHSISLEGIDSGVYIVQLKLANQMLTQKVVLN